MPEEQKEGVARGAKMRTLGNIRLIAELFKKSVVPEKIVHMCVSDLTGDAQEEPSENNVEVCTTTLCTQVVCMWIAHCTLILAFSPQSDIALCLVLQPIWASVLSSNSTTLE